MNLSPIIFFKIGPGDERCELAGRNLGPTTAAGVVLHEMKQIRRIIEVDQREGMEIERTRYETRRCSYTTK